MSGYDTPRTPPATPPVVDPEVEPKSAAEMEAEGESEGDVLGHRSNPDEIDTELTDKLTWRDRQDGTGEMALNLPPD